MDGEKKVAAVILNYNSSEDCRKCVSYLRGQTYDNLSIIIVDNASPNPNERNALESLCNKYGIAFIQSDENRGFSAGNNIGLRSAVQSGADWMLVINPDVELRDPEYIRSVMQELPNWPEAAVVGTNVLLPSGEKQNPMREVTALEEILWPLEMVKQKLGIWDGYRSKDETGYCEKVSGCCFFISREFLLQNDYLDENVFMYCEEPILAKSVIKRGFRELYIREVTANHEHYAAQKSGSSGKRMTEFLKSRTYYIENYSGYNKTLTKMAVFSRRIQSIMWMRKIF